MKLKNALQNEYVKSIIFLVIILGSIVAFWFALKTFLNTDFPLLAVASESMVPTLNVGDLIIVQGGLRAEDINATNNVGDVIVFHSPRNPNELIVHRAVDKQETDGIWHITTKGDNNPVVDTWNVLESDIVGKVVGTVPFVGHIPLFVHTSTGMTLIVVLIVILVLLEFIIPVVKERVSSEQPEAETSDLGSL